MNKRQIGEQVHRLTEQHAEKFSCNYEEALHAVLDADPALKAAYVGDLPGGATLHLEPGRSAKTADRDVQGKLGVDAGRQKARRADQLLPENP